MDYIWLIVIMIVIVLALLGIFVIHIYNKYQFAIIKIDEAENNISLLLEKKLDFLSRLVPLLKENTKDETNDFEKVLLLKSKKMNDFELNYQLKKQMRELHRILDNHPDLEQIEAIVKIEEELYENEDDLDAVQKYYNDNVVIYNKLGKCFPSNIISLFCHYKNKKFYSEEKEEMFEILKK